MGFIARFIITLAITMAITLAITITLSTDSKIQKDLLSGPSEAAVQNDNTKLIPSKRLSRFLKEEDYERNPRAADHCHKDNDVCGYIDRTHNSTCCNNKCMDLHYDNHNCGACKKKCKFTQSCCRGECVYLPYDKRHCGKCNNKCLNGEYCTYGICGYA